jgi:hypothetical protein
MYPVFSLVLDKDVSAEIVMTYPELYKELTKVIVDIRRLIFLCNRIKMLKHVKLYKLLACYKNVV